MSDEKSAPPPPRAAHTGNWPQASGNIRTLRSSDLLADAQEVVIEHGGDHYRLRTTRNGKLILTK